LGGLFKISKFKDIKIDEEGEVEKDGKLLIQIEKIKKEGGSRNGSL